MNRSERPFCRYSTSTRAKRYQGSVARCKSVATETKRAAKRVDMDAMTLLGHGHGDSHEVDAVFPDPDNIDVYISGVGTLYAPFRGTSGSHRGRQ
jgi:hypothetical protein